MHHRPRARRYPFVASVELTDTETEEQVWGQTTEVSLFGCRVEKVRLLPPDTKVSIRIVHLGHSLLALGRVVYARGGMGIVFTKIEGNKGLVLEKWIAELRPAHNQ
jgi:PilZ domain-containing protein